MTYTREQIDKDWRESARLETERYGAELPRIYSQVLAEAAAATLYDEAAILTNDFREITPEVVARNPRIVKILRFLTAPTSSQMKLGQLLGVDTTGPFESGNAIDSRQAQRLVDAVLRDLEDDRLPWRTATMSDSELGAAKRFARLWTCSLIANQNATTVFRNWRKAVQEQAIQEVIQRAGYQKMGGKAVLARVADLPSGHYSTERKVAGVPAQKADFVLGMDEGTLLALEAKAVGVRLDATKRMKEIRNKFTAWRTEFGRQISVGAVIAGWVPAHEVQTLIDEAIELYWEHRLEDLARRIDRGKQ